MKTFAALIFAFACLVTLVMADNPRYRDECVTIQYWRGKNGNEVPQIIAECPVKTDQPDSYRCTTLKLDMCYANAFGRLEPRLNGGFSSSCSDCIMESTKLTCTCANGSGGTTRASTETNDLIKNAASLLSCFGHNGIWCSDAGIGFHVAENITATDYVRLLNSQP
ncbi:hypothetical protein JX266_004143 [Neoarthrinium moseri]|uniref:uncharacterized protein n=1 Tax=Neoarthrinium moseri TaxID=1658444 RepID=UPI001FDBDCA2|nr:uncharacterized protein JN550_007493 [Neoarthrinium moseri]KAI1850285.1 hypothetical protein JX266_004143 [Neoarthrinium moseri]KAI1866640.1 hypothetical protein JN550_007493 [Neoarthrinium moseri]